MAHAVSASYLRSEHMSPQGMALALLLHALVAFFLWWMSHNLPPIPLSEDVVEVSFEQPKPPEPPPTAMDIMRHEQQTAPPCPILNNVPCLGKIMHGDPLGGGAQPF